MPADVDATMHLPGLSPVAGKPIIARFDGGSRSSDGGPLTLRDVEACLGVAARLAGCIDEADTAGGRGMLQRIVQQVLQDPVEQCGVEARLAKTCRHLAPDHAASMRVLRVRALPRPADAAPAIAALCLPGKMRLGAIIAIG